MKRTIYLLEGNPEMIKKLKFNFGHVTLCRTETINPLKYNTWCHGVRNILEVDAFGRYPTNMQSAAVFLLHSAAVVETLLSILRKGEAVLGTRFIDPYIYAHVKKVLRSHDGDSFFDHLNQFANDFDVRIILLYGEREILPDDHSALRFRSALESVRSFLSGISNIRTLCVYGSEPEECLNQITRWRDFLDKK